MTELAQFQLSLENLAALKCQKLQKIKTKQKEYCMFPDK